MDELRKAATQARDLWNKLSRGRRLMILMALLGTGGLVAAVSLRGDTTRYATLYAGMRPEDAATIVDSLKEQKVAYRLGAGGTQIEVPEDKVPEVRLVLAQKGLPRGGGVGFEIFDKQSFGATSFTEKMNYLRALQGELARSILTLEEVEAARVHLALPERSLYKSSDKQPSASVALRLRPGRHLGAPQVRGIAFLVAGSVEGMTPAQVTIVDESGRMLSRGDDAEGGLELQQELEGSLAARVREVVEPLVGAGHATVVVTVDLDRARTERTEELYDKDRTALRSESRTAEGSDAAAATASGVAGTQGNLPGAPAPSTSALPGGLTRLQETRNYEVNRVIAKTTGAPVNVKQIHVAVLVDQPGPRERSAAELERIGALARVAAGLSKERGDVIEVSSAPFVAAAPDATLIPPAAPGARAWPLPVSPLVAAGAGAGLLVILVAAAAILLRRRGGEDGKAQPLLPSLPVKVGELEAVVASDRLPGAAGPPMLASPDSARDRAHAAARADAVRAARLLSAWLGEKTAQENR